MVIYRHKERYPISVMCQFFGVSRIGYYGFYKRIGDPEPDAELAELLQSQQERCRQTYGYRRMWLWLEKQGIHRNPKTVLRVMKKYNILAEIRRPRKWVRGSRCTSMRIFSTETFTQMLLTKNGYQIFLISIQTKRSSVCPLFR